MVGLGPGLAVSHATHLLASALFCTIHAPHSQLPAALLNNEPNPEPPILV